jgi:hypothetical protein
MSLICLERLGYVLRPHPVLRLGLWGAKSLVEPRPDEIVTPDSLVLALRSTFRPEATGELRASFELRIGEIVVHARLDPGALEVDAGPLPSADLVLETDRPLPLWSTGELGPNAAIESGSVRVACTRELLARFVEIFHLPPGPVALPV